jgi:DNA invertase Pin-like site-specific DNA recombinase
MPVDFQRMLAFARQGDTIVVESISRFARNTKDLLELMEKLTAKGVGFISKKEAIDTGTPTGKFMLTVFAAVAELEREYILQRQREGIAVAKQAGKYKGRKPIDRAGLQPVLEEYHKGLLTAAQAMRKMGVSRSTFYRLLAAR